MVETGLQQSQDKSLSTHLLLLWRIYCFIYSFRIQNILVDSFGSKLMQLRSYHLVTLHRTSRYEVLYCLPLGSSNKNALNSTNDRGSARSIPAGYQSIPVILVYMTFEYTSPIACFRVDNVAIKFGETKVYRYGPCHIHFSGFLKSYFFHNELVGYAHNFVKSACIFHTNMFLILKIHK